MSTILHRQTARFVAAIAANLPEMTGEEMQSWIGSPASLKSILAEVFCPLVKAVHMIAVDYSKCWEVMVVEGKYDCFSSRLWEDFPNSVVCEENKVVVMGVAVLRKKTHLSHIPDLLKKEGYRPATLQELLAFAEEGRERKKLHIFQGRNNVVLSLDRERKTMNGYYLAENDRVCQAGMAFLAVREG
jgi:hypothetical protein